MTAEIQELKEVLTPIILTELQERLNSIIPGIVESSIMQAMLQMSEGSKERSIDIIIPDRDTLLDAIVSAEQ